MRNKSNFWPATAYVFNEIPSSLNLGINKEELFQKVQERKKTHYFNNPLLLLNRFSLESGTFNLDFMRSDYRDFVISREWPELFPIAVSPIGVTGVCMGGGKVILGRRSKNVAQYPGYWEMVPSGSLEDENYTEQIKLEFEEELGKSRDSIITSSPIGMIYDGNMNLFDLVILLKTEFTVSDLTPTREYEEFCFFERGDLSEFMASTENVVPSSRLLAASLSEMSASLGWK